MLFSTRIRGIPCQVDVTQYVPPLPMRHVGNGEYDPPEPEQFEFEVYSTRGKPIPWLKELVNDRIEEQLKAQFLQECTEERDYWVG